LRIRFLPLAVASLILFSAITIVLASGVSVSAIQVRQVSPGYECWTDRSEYQIGDTVTIYVLIPPVYTLGPYSLVVYKPDGSSSLLYSGELEPANTHPFGGQAGPPAGERRLEFSSEAGPLCYATYYVIGGPADLMVTSVQITPRNPHQEDMVMFSVGIANIGGTDANDFLVELYLDGNLWSSIRTSLATGQSTGFSSDREYQAEDGPHDIRWILNSDQRVEESDYGNNEGRASFFVSPRTVTVTEHATITRTKTQTEKQTLTVTTTRTLMRTHTTDTTVQSTVTENPVTTTQILTGLITSTVYSPTVTTTIVPAQMISNPLPWMILSTFGLIGAAFQLPKDGRLRRFFRRLAAILPLPELLAWLTKRQGRKALFTVCLISVVVLSITSQASVSVYASTVTITRTLTSIEWTTLIQSLTSTRYITTTATDTSTSTRTSRMFTTVTPTTTQTVDHRSITTIYLPTTTYVTSLPAVELLRVYTIPEPPEMNSRYGLYFDLKNGDPKQSHEVVIRVVVAGASHTEPTWEVNAETTTGHEAVTLILKPGEGPVASSIGLRSDWNWISGNPPVP
jgi:hypothetical protein